KGASPKTPFVYRLPSVAQPVVADLVEQRAVGEIQETRRSRAVAARALQGAPDETPLELLGTALHGEIAFRRSGIRREAGSMHQLGQLRAADRSTGEEQSALDEVLQ